MKYSQFAYYLLSFFHHQKVIFPTRETSDTAGVLLLVFPPSYWIAVVIELGSRNQYAKRIQKHLTPLRFFIHLKTDTPINAR